MMSDQSGRTHSQQVRVEWGIRQNGVVWPVPEWVAERGVDPHVWAERVTGAEGGAVVRREVITTDWLTAPTRTPSQNTASQPPDSNDPKGG